MFLKLTDNDGNLSVVRGEDVVAIRDRALPRDTAMKAKTVVFLGTRGKMYSYVRETPEEILKLLPSA